MTVELPAQAGAGLPCRTSSQYPQPGNTKHKTQPTARHKEGCPWWPLNQQKPCTLTTCQPKVTLHKSVCHFDPSGKLSGTVMTTSFPLDLENQCPGSHGRRKGGARLSALPGVSLLKEGYLLVLTCLLWVGGAFVKHHCRHLNQTHISERGKTRFLAASFEPADLPQCQ